MQPSIFYLIFSIDKLTFSSISLQRKKQDQMNLDYDSKIRQYKAIILQIARPHKGIQDTTWPHKATQGHKGHTRPKKSIPYNNVPQKTTTFFVRFGTFLIHSEHFYCEHFLFGMTLFFSCFHHAKNKNKNNDIASFRTFDRCSRSKKNHPWLIDYRIESAICIIKFSFLSI